MPHHFKAIEPKAEKPKEPEEIEEDDFLGEEPKEEDVKDRLKKLSKKQKAKE